MKNLTAMFSPYYLFKDLVTIFIYVALLMWIVSYLPNVLGDSENYVIKYILVTVKVNLWQQIFKLSGSP